MADEVAVTDSASVAEAAPSEVAVEQADVTHGDAPEQATPADDTAAAEEVSTDDGDDEDEPSDEHQTEEEKTKAQKRRERRQAKEQERIAAAVQAEVERIQRENEVKATQAEAEAKQRQADEAWQKRFGELVGTPEVHQSLEQEIATLTREIVSLRPYAGDTDLDVLEQKQAALDAKIAQRDTLATNKKLYDDIDKYQFEMTKNEFLVAANGLPADHAREYLKAQTVPEALRRLEVGIVAREAAKHAADKAAAVKAVTTELEKERAAHAATRTGGPGAGPVPATGGSGGSGSGVLTYERYMAMTTEQRLDIKPAERDAMMQRHLASKR